MNLGRPPVLATVLASMLAGCATPPPAGVADEVLSGRIAVRVEGQPDRGVNAGFELSGSARQGLLVLTGPLGSTAARAHWTPGEAVLERSDGQVHYADLDELTAAALGEAVPIAALFDWLHGRAWPGAVAGARSDDVAGFEQLGWRVDLARWSEGWIEARRSAPPAITVRARLEPKP